MCHGNMRREEQFLIIVVSHIRQSNEKYNCGLPWLPLASRVCNNNTQSRLLVYLQRKIYVRQMT